LSVRDSKKGLLSLLDVSLARKDDRLEECFRKKLTEGIFFVHKDCRKRYTNLRSIQRSLEPTAKKSSLDGKLIASFAVKNVLYKVIQETPDVQNLSC